MIQKALRSILDLFKDRFLLILILAFLLMLFFINPTSYVYDRGTFYTWFTYLKNEGFWGMVNHEDVNYMPIYLYIMNFFSMLFPTAEAINQNIHYLKAISLFFDFAGIYLLVRIFRHFKIPQDNVFFVLFNLAYLYNTLFWMQIDSIHSFFIMLSLWAVIKKRLKLSTIALVIAFNIKLQSIIFAPLWLLLLIPTLVKNKKKILAVFLSLIVSELVIIAPYLISNNWGAYTKVIFGSIDFFEILSMHAFNIWYVIVGAMARWTEDTGLFIGLSYKTWGYLMFAAGLIATFIPMLHIVFRKLKNKKEDFNETEISIALLSAVLTIFSFFYFNTQMHERYLHPLLLPLAAFAFINKKYILYVLISLLYFLNLEKILLLLPVDHYSLIFSSRLIAVLLGATLLLCFYYLYSYYFSLKKKWQQKR